MNKMNYREITLADGRYMIFYTFAEAGAPASRTESPDAAPSDSLPANAGGSDPAPKDTDV